MGVGTILDARELLLLATGGAKASILAKAVEGPITAMISASALRLHRNCKVIIDEDAAPRPQRARLLRLDLPKRAGVAAIPNFGFVTHCRFRKLELRFTGHWLMLQTIAWTRMLRD